MRIRFEFKHQDLWVGVFWKSTPVTLENHKSFFFEHAYIPEVHPARTDIWICFIPMLPIHLIFEKSVEVQYQKVT